MPALDHTCSAACRDGEHAELVYTDDTDMRRITAEFGRHYHVRVTGIQPAPEAPTFAAMERFGLVARCEALTWGPPDDTHRWLVWFRWGEEGDR